MLDYKKTEDIERMKAEAVKRLKWPKIPGLNEAFPITGLYMQV